ncbi:MULTISPECIES: HsdM family class I SAM-dependent methyltransferase [Flavobacterium]|uniref:site-specific DNA-methyltransferase (adenine-specific) n=1 Tax=Flavobacterium microcysteis TaxID=2596891 RepID=A0A501Q1B1_9FLAO|nr:MULTISPECIES: N-6 DNA methylase [Flavobacterium]TPD65977.1 endonuclease [Flavobacterium microcysteis]
MTGKEFVASIGLDRAVSVNSDSKKLSESQSIILDQVSEFNVDAVYFNTDDAGNSFPAIFVKNVISFDSKTLRQIAEIQRKIWNFKKVFFLYVCSELELRIYNCSEKPLIITRNNFNEEKELQKIEVARYVFSDVEKLGELNRLFSTMAIDSGSIWTLEEADFVRKKINIQKRVDKYLVESLINTAKQLEEQGIEINLIHRLILRSLFLLYLEDRDATDESFYSNIMEGAKSFFDILEDTTATYTLFQRLEDHFNGNVFTVTDDENINVEHLQLIKKCFISGNDNTPQVNLFEDWRIFDFSIIQIELLSEIYENFLFKTDPELKKQTGTYYTPPALVEFILNEQLPVNNGETDYKLKILDPACGSGIFLVESFKRLVKRHENSHGQKLTDFNELRKLLTEHIFGIEIHPQAIKVAAFSLYLALVDNLNPKTVWQNKNYRLPNLINNPNDPTLKEQGNNLFCRDTIDTNPEIEAVKFDLVVGNPPFGTDIKSDAIRTYCERHGFAKEMVLPFLHKAALFAPNGKIALIFNTKVLTNTGSTYQKFRTWLFNDCYVEKVYNFSILRNAKKNFGGQLFGDATGPISIVYYQKETPREASDKITYYAPKTYIKSSIIEGLSIDFTDLKYLPREECKKENTKIWKVAMFGTASDIGLIDRLLGNSTNIGTYIKEHKLDYGVGLQPVNKSTIKPLTDNEIANLSFIRPERINRFTTNPSSFSHINLLLKDKKTIQTYLDYYGVKYLQELPTINVFRRLGAKDVYPGPMLLVKEGFLNNKLCTSFVKESIAFNSTVLGLKSNDEDQLRFLSSVLNSELATYFLLMISNSWGIERERIKPNEVYKFPVVIKQSIIDEMVGIHKKIEDLIHASIMDVNYSQLEEQLNRLVYELYDIDIIERQLVKDFIVHSFDLFTRQEKSSALYSVLQDQITAYENIVSTEINDFLDGQQLFVNVTSYNISTYSPLMLTKLTFENEKRETKVSQEYVDDELRLLDNFLWEKKATNIYFRKKLNYKDGKDIFIIRPNQRRFWSESMALEDASELILEILNGN